MPLHLICLGSWVISHCAIVSQCTQLSSTDRHLVCFQVFVIVHLSTVGHSLLCLQTSVRVLAFLWYAPRKEARWAAGCVQRQTMPDKFSKATVTIHTQRRNRPATAESQEPKVNLPRFAVSPSQKPAKPPETSIAD